MLLLTLGLLTPFETAASISMDSLVTIPAPPTCEESFQLVLSGGLSDSCWSVDEIEFVIAGSSVGFTAYLSDSWMPGYECLQWLLPYGASETIGPLPAGDYNMFAIEHRNSLRQPGSSAVYLPTLTCCEGAPATVSDLRLAKTPTGNKIQLNWSDALGATNYNLYGDLDPAGSFAVMIGSASTGQVGIELGQSGPTEFFLLATSSSCGEGPKH